MVLPPPISVAARVQANIRGPRLLPAIVKSEAFLTLLFDIVYAVHRIINIYRKIIKSITQL